MIDFENNWQITLAEELPEGATTMTLGLGFGRYRITLADSLSNDATRELVTAFVDAAGVVTLVRGTEFTTPRTWPAGSIAYMSITAEVLQSVFIELQSLRARVAALDSRPNVQYLEIEYTRESWAEWDYIDQPYIRSILYTFPGDAPISLPLDELVYADGSPVLYSASLLGAPAARLSNGMRLSEISIDPYWLTPGATIAVTLGGIPSFDGAVRVRSNSAPEVATAEAGFSRSATDITVTITAAA